MVTDGKLLAQDDIDALLNEAGLEGDYEDESNQAGGEQQSTSTSFPQTRKIPTEQYESTLAHLRERASLEREEGIKIIWNAFKSLPMTAGLKIKIQEQGYVSMGVLEAKHLIVAKMD